MLPEVLEARTVTVRVPTPDGLRDVALPLDSFTLVVRSVSGTVPAGLSNWDAQLAFGGEADRLLVALTHP